MIQLDYNSLSTTHKRYTSFKIGKLLYASPQEIQEVLEKENIALILGQESTIVSIKVLNQIQRELPKRNYSIN